MSKIVNCPICFDPLITKQLTPCMDCGGEESELTHFKEHEYNEWEIIFGERLILCDFCDVDFASYKSDFFGFKNRRVPGFEHFSFVRKLDWNEIQLQYGRFC